MNFRLAAGTSDSAKATTDKAALPGVAQPVLKLIQHRIYADQIK